MTSEHREVGNAIYVYLRVREPDFGPNSADQFTVLRADFDETTEALSILIADFNVFAVSQFGNSPKVNFDPEPNIDMLKEV